MKTWKSTSPNPNHFGSEPFFCLTSSLIVDASRIYIEIKPNSRKDVVLLLLNDVSGEELTRIRKNLPETETRQVRISQIKVLALENAAELTAEEPAPLVTEAMEGINSPIYLLETMPDPRDGAAANSRIAQVLDSPKNRLIHFGKGSLLVIDGSRVDVHVVGEDSVIVETAGRHLRWKTGEAFSRAIEIEAPGAGN